MRILSSISLSPKNTSYRAKNQTFKVLKTFLEKTSRTDQFVGLLLYRIKFFLSISKIYSSYFFMPVDRDLAIESLKKPCSYPGLFFIRYSKIKVTIND